MGRWEVATKLLRWRYLSSHSSCRSISQSSKNMGSLECRRVAIARMATKSGDGTKKNWRQWVENKIQETPPTPGSKATSSSASSTGKASSSSSSTAVDDFERYVLGKTGDEESEGMETDFHEIREEVEADQKPEKEDDFLQELTKIERGGDSWGGDSWGRKPRKDDLMLQRGYDDENVPFDNEVDPENDESLLDQEDAVFWSEELNTFVTPKGLLSLPGMGREEINKPYQLRPDRLYFPGQSIEPEDFDVTRLPSSDPTDGPPKAKKVLRKNEVLAAADFRNVRFLSLFLSETSRILPRRSTTVSWKSQRKISREIKTARALGLLPFSSMGDPPFRYLRNKPAKDIDPEDEYDEYEDEESGGGTRFRRRLF